jgi:biotin carboxylase
VISTCSDQLNVVACQVSESLGLPHPYSSEIALDVTHKLRMKQKMIAQGIPTAPFFCVNDPQDKEIENPKLRFPLIVKPADNCGSKGVRQVKDRKALAEALSTALPLSRSGQALVEVFQPGREICVDCFVQDAVPHMISIYEKFNLYGDTTVIQCFRSLRPVVLSPQVEDALQTIVKQITSTFGLRHTTLFIQTIVQDSHISVIEFAARAPGGIAYRATQLDSGFDLIQASIASFLQRPYPVSVSSQSDLITTNSIYGRPGVLGWVSGVEDLLERGVIEAYYPYKTKGMRLSPALASQDRVGGFIVRAQTQGELLEKTQLAMDTLEIYDVEGRRKMLRAPFEGVGTAHIYGVTL